MSPSPRLPYLARQFWEAAGPPAVTPYPIADAVSWALPVSLAYAPGLTLAGVAAWFRRRRLPAPALAGPNRPLRGCLVAQQGQAILLIDSQDSPAERRFTIAHEAAHFILEYQEPRQAARLALGEAALAALDGQRAPTLAERIGAALAGVELRAHTHFLDRSADGGLADAATWRAESEADQLALELLAPAAVALAQALPAAARRFAAQVEATARLLEAQFGLPPAVAQAYANQLRWQAQGGPSVAEWLGL